MQLSKAQNVNVTKL